MKEKIPEKTALYLGNHSLTKTKTSLHKIYEVRFSLYDSRIITLYSCTYGINAICLALLIATVRAL